MNTNCRSGTRGRTCPPSWLLSPRCVYSCTTGRSCDLCTKRRRASSRGTRDCRIERKRSLARAPHTRRTPPARRAQRPTGGVVKLCSTAQRVSRLSQTTVKRVRFAAAPRIDHSAALGYAGRPTRRTWATGTPSSSWAKNDERHVPTSRRHRQLGGDIRQLGGPDEPCTLRPHTLSHRTVRQATTCPQLQAPVSPCCAQRAPGTHLTRLRSLQPGGARAQLWGRPPRAGSASCRARRVGQPWPARAPG